MYLEISARRTGKTRRLAEAVKEHLKDGGEAIVVMPWSLKHLDLMNLPRNEPKLFTLSIWHLERPPIVKLQGVKLDNPRWFYEEFDFLGNLMPHITENGYYVTTPRFTRKIWEMPEDQIKTDVLFSLLELNKWQHVAYGWNFFDHQLMGIRDEFSEKDRETEILGIFAS